MLTRRFLTTSSIAGLVALGSARPYALLAQTPVAGLEYQGVLAIQNLPELPTAPAGECAIVMQAVGIWKSVAAVYHNATDEVMAVNAVSATSTSKYGTESMTVAEESNHGPHILQPGDYGIATPTFKMNLDDEDVVVFEIVAVPEAEGDPSVVSMPISSVAFSRQGDSQTVETDVTIRAEGVVAAGSGALAIFFTPDGEILDWFSTNSLLESDPGKESHGTFGSPGLKVSDSFMMVYGGRLVD